MNTSNNNYEARSEFLKGSDEIGVLVIHGFTGSPQSMRLVAHALHKKGYTVQLPCLKGHGTTPEDMESSSYQDWINSVKKAYDELTTQVKEVFVFGLSMGGTLSLYSGINFKINGIITVNAAIEMPSIIKDNYEDASLPRFLSGIGADIKKEGVTEWAYDRTPRKNLGDILELTHLVKDRLSEIKVPILIFKSVEDHVIPSSNQEYIYKHIGSSDKELVELFNSYHVATLDNDLNIILDKTLQFIKEKNSIQKLNIK